MKKVCVWLFGSGLASFTSAQPADVTKITGLMSAATTEKELVIESKGGPVSYKAVVDRNQGGDIKQLCLPADSGPAMSDLNDIFFYGRHDNEYTLRGWSALAKCIQSSSAEGLSRKPDEVVVQVCVDAAGTFKVISTAGKPPNTSRCWLESKGVPMNDICNSHCRRRGNESLIHPNCGAR